MLLDCPQINNVDEKSLLRVRGTKLLILNPSTVIAIFDLVYLQEAMTIARNKIMNLNDTQYYHITNRVVQQAYLAGKDISTGRDYSHRKLWIEQRILMLSEVFSIDVLAYCVMSNHYHLCVFVDVQRALEMPDEHVIERWARIGMVKQLASKLVDCESRMKLTDVEISQAKEIVDNYRKRLCNISWMMRYLNEYIAKRANKEDGKKGHFWESRFFSQALLDHESVINCMAYDDLNPVKAGVSKSYEQTTYTSISRRLKHAKLNIKDAKMTPMHLKPISAVSNENFVSNITLREYCNLLKDKLDSVGDLGKYESRPILGANIYFIGRDIKRPNASKQYDASIINSVQAFKV